MRLVLLPMIMFLTWCKIFISKLFFIVCDILVEAWNYNDLCVCVCVYINFNLFQAYHILTKNKKNKKMTTIMIFFKGIYVMRLRST